MYSPAVGALPAIHLLPDSVNNRLRPANHVVQFDSTTLQFFDYGHAFRLGWSTKAPETPTTLSRPTQTTDQATTPTAKTWRQPSAALPPVQAWPTAPPARQQRLGHGRPPAEPQKSSSDTRRLPSQTTQRPLRQGWRRPTSPKLEQGQHLPERLRTKPWLSGKTRFDCR